MPTGAQFQVECVTSSPWEVISIDSTSWMARRRLTRWDTALAICEVFNEEGESLAAASLLSSAGQTGKSLFDLCRRHETRANAPHLTVPFNEQSRKARDT